MSMSTEEKIRHYQRSIERSLSDRERLLHCIAVLSKLPVTVLHLEVTGVGRTVNALRKIDNGVGDSARRLVNKWKSMVSNTRSSNDEDEACVPDAPDSYESPDCDSDAENQQKSYDYYEPEALRQPAPSLPDALDISNEINSYAEQSSDDRTETANCTSEELEDTCKPNQSLKRSSKESLSKDKSSKKDKKSQKDRCSSSGSKDKNESLSENSKRKDKNKNKYESISSSSSSSSLNKDKKSSEHKKRKYSSSDDDENDKKKRKESSSEEDVNEVEKDNLVIYDEESDPEENEPAVNDEEEEEEEEEQEVEDVHKEVKKISSSKESKESSLKGKSHSDKSKSKEKHRDSSSHSKTKTHESSDKSKKTEKQSSSKSHKEEKSKSDKHHSKESSKSKTSHSSSSSKSHSKHKDKEKDESKNKDKKSEKEKTNEKVIKDDRGKCAENKEHKERKESKDHKKSKEHKDRHKDQKEHKKVKDQKDKKESKNTKKNADEEEEGGIDGNSGTSFAEALGMCMMPPPSKKKKENIPSTSTKSSKTESPSPSPSTPSTSSTSSNSKSSTVKTKCEPPDSPESLPLLSSNVKLEPLSEINEEVDLASTLPEPSPYYKPLPQVNHVQRKIDEDNMLAQVIYAKNQRTKVYSGNKTGYTSVPTLSEMCIRLLIENIDALEYTGGVPYYIMKPVLERATPDQLFMLENHNPYLIEDTDALWQFHCNKDFRNKHREEMESWRDMYMRCLDEREAKLKALTANIKQSIDKSQPVRSTKLAYVDHVVKPPRNVLRQQAKYGTANATSKSINAKQKIIAAASGQSSSSTSSSSSSGTGPPVERISVPPPPPARQRQSSSMIKKAKAPLMAKALQAIKGRYKR